MLQFPFSLFWMKSTSWLHIILGMRNSRNCAVWAGYWPNVQVAYMLSVANLKQILSAYLSHGTWHIILLIKDLNKRVYKLDITTLKIKIYLMNLHSLSVILAHLLDLMEVFYYVLYSWVTSSFDLSWTWSRSSVNSYILNASSQSWWYCGTCENKPLFFCFKQLYYQNRNGLL